mmetsp:Transcript_52304/g.86758  ORF Transcript_52304/g.86758 Transcript_52304/m.86758 type:complete len:206 (-) Transcript_52304:139-756(-)
MDRARIRSSSRRLFGRFRVLPVGFDQPLHCAHAVALRAQTFADVRLQLLVVAHTHDLFDRLHKPAQQHENLQVLHLRRLVDHQDVEPVHKQITTLPGSVVQSRENHVLRRVQRHVQIFLVEAALDHACTHFPLVTDAHHLVSDRAIILDGLLRDAVHRAVAVADYEHALRLLFDQERQDAVRDQVRLAGPRRPLDQHHPGLCAAG